MIDIRAQAIADDVLFPSALAIEAADRVPAAQFDLLAAEGFYGLAADDSIDHETSGRVVAALAGGCLTTAFVWLQHMTPVRAALEHGRTDLLPALVAGEVRAGIGLAGIRNPNNPMRVRPSGPSYRLTGTIPWVTGWGMIDRVYVAARDDAGMIHYLLVDAVASPALSATRQSLVAVNASGTVNLTLDDLEVPADRLIWSQPYQEWLTNDSSGSSTNGFLAIGVIARCCRLLGPSPLNDELVAARAALVDADSASMPAARAMASELAVRAASALTVSVGARAVLTDQHAQRLLREAAFLLVFGSRPIIRTALLDRLRALPHELV